jgi:DNA replication protein
MFDLNKLAMIIVNKQAPIEKNNTNIYEVFEKEFGRTLSPMEYEIIGGWLDKDCTEELILLALKEAVYNGVNNMRYIDRIIYEWIKKGIKTKQDVENNRKQFKKKEQTIEVVDYDWLNDSE